MLPNMVILQSQRIVPHDRVAGFLTAAFGDSRLAPVMALYWSFFLCFLPIGLRIVYFSLKGHFSDLTNNINPRAQRDELRKSDHIVAMLSNSHENMLENFPFFAAATLAGLHARVNASVLSDMCTFWVALRTAYFVAFALSALTGSVALSYVSRLHLHIARTRETATPSQVRTVVFLTSLATVAKMLLLAAEM